MYKAKICALMAFLNWVQENFQFLKIPGFFKAA